MVVFPLKWCLIKNFVFSDVLHLWIYTTHGCEFWDILMICLNSSSDGINNGAVIETSGKKILNSSSMYELMQIIWKREIINEFCRFSRNLVQYLGAELQIWEQYFICYLNWTLQKISSTDKLFLALYRYTSLFVLHI